uniref:Uncharacterized protein n=1 Tax=Manihot esculenta TaxID=3983 RepID=A0A2C9U086_MANES
MKQLDMGSNVCFEPCEVADLPPISFLYKAMPSEPSICF